MKKLVMLVSAAAFAFAFGSFDAVADGKKGAIVSQSIGTYGPVTGPATVGELITCAADEGQSPINVSYQYLRGICDDRGAGGLSACAGRYTGYGEECARGFDLNSAGTVSSNHTTGRFRVCFSDPATAPGDCALTVPTGKVIAEGTTRSHTNHVSGTEILLGVGEAILEDDEKWYADGKNNVGRKKWER